MRRYHLFSTHDMRSSRLEMELGVDVVQLTAQVSWPESLEIDLGGRV